MAPVFVDCEQSIETFVTKYRTVEEACSGVNPSGPPMQPSPSSVLDKLDKMVVFPNTGYRFDAGTVDQACFDSFSNCQSFNVTSSCADAEGRRNCVNEAVKKCPTVVVNQFNSEFRKGIDEKVRVLCDRAPSATQTPSPSASETPSAASPTPALNNLDKMVIYPGTGLRFKPGAVTQACFDAFKSCQSFNVTSSCTEAMQRRDCVDKALSSCSDAVRNQFNNQFRTPIDDRVLKLCDRLPSATPVGSPSEKTPTPSLEPASELDNMVVFPKSGLRFDAGTVDQQCFDSFSTCNQYRVSAACQDAQTRSVCVGEAVKQCSIEVQRQYEDEFKSKIESNVAVLCGSPVATPSSSEAPDIPGASEAPIGPSQAPTGATPSPSAPLPVGPNQPSPTVGTSLEPSASEQSTDEGSVCFPGSVKVITRQGLTLMKDLTIGDEVMTASGQYSPVYFFSHRSKTSVHSFIKLTTEEGKLTLSRSHYVYTEGNSMKSAGSIRVGDRVMIAGDSTEPVLVVGVEEVQDIGLYNPHTMSGDLLADGFKVSCYTRTVNPLIAHALLGPIRAAYTAGIRVSGFLDSSVPTFFTWISPRGDASAF